MLLRRIAILILSLLIGMTVATLLLGDIKGFTREGLEESTRDNCELLLNRDGTRFSPAQVESCVSSEMKGHDCAVSYSKEYDCVYKKGISVPMHRQLIECVVYKPMVVEKIFSCFRN